MGTYRLFPSTDGPSSPVSYTGDFLAGVLFCVTSNCWFEGYWWWVCPTGQSTSPQKFALWQVYGGGEGNVVPGSVVTSGTPDRRAVELHSPGDPAPAEHRQRDRAGCRHL